MTRTAIITGPTSRIGLGSAKTLAAPGCNVMPGGLGDAAQIVETRARRDAASGGTAAYDDADVKKPDQIADLVAQTETRRAALTGIAMPVGGGRVAQ
ncbi:MAG: hypothetical protein AAFQ19_05315 [Pseudomonadota bacterium]